jgi:ASPIC and UnbV/FG-GAP-like repeat
MKCFRLQFVWLPVLLIACQSRQTLFENISSSRSGIGFNNSITENDSINPIDVVNVYNGGGVGIGDFNNDSLQDIYFTGNMVSSKLYLNKGDFKFEDATVRAGAEGMGRWARGVSVIDINNDGLQDIYICNTIYKDSLKRRNILYVNQGADKEGIPHFKDMAAEYGLDIHVQSTMANFFDYDNDGDLDMYLTVNEAFSDENRFGKGAKEDKISKGRLYKKDWDSLANHAVFRDVSFHAGVTLDGPGHGATVADINRDGWKDIYVSNDFMSDNILYINNRNGTFTNSSRQYFKHTSVNAMGQDIIDINNDGLSDVVELDMNPRDNYRKKMMLGSNNYNIIQNFEMYGHQYQYVRNTLQLNQGPRLLENDSVGAPVFSEIGFMSGIAETDWSWTPLLTDFDNDGYRDMVVTNGFPKDITDHDFIVYRHDAVYEPPLKLLDKIPEVKLMNYGFKNADGLFFNDVTANWGLTTPSFSNGAAYADFDNDGDMDMVVNNINDVAFLYRNTLRKKEDTNSHFLQIKFIGSKENKDGIGAWADIYYNGGKHQAYENTPYRGYLSTNQNIAHFGLGNAALIDSVIIKWPGDKKQTITTVNANQFLKVNIADAKENYHWQPSALAKQPVFKEVTQSLGIDYLSRDADFIDFNIQATLPHKLSEYNPALAAGDIDGNGLDDMVAGGNTFAPPVFFLQQPGGKFIQKIFLNKNEQTVTNSKDEGMLLFDVNGDSSLDLYIASGGYKFEGNSANYQDRLYVNDGKGNFTLADSSVLPKNYTSKLCVKAMDFNNDGKLDLFVSGRVDPWKYPKPVSSFIFRNDSDKGKIKFTDVTAEVAPELKNIGMVCDALFTDFDNDHQVDLILTGEWMPVTFFKNTGGKFKNVSVTSGINDKPGWWNSIVAGDFRHTGRTDYIVGNAGLNTIYKASDEHPVFVTAKDFDHTDGYVPILSYFLPDKEAGILKEFPAAGRDDILERVPSLRKRYVEYKAFATSDMNEIFTSPMQKDAQHLKVTMLQSCYLRNDGNGKFTMIPLPKEAQFAVLNGMLADDFDGDGNLDVLINGNDYGTEVSIGRFDALNGLLLKGDGSGGFSPLSILQSGIYIPGNGKALVKLLSAKGSYLVAASQYKGPLKVFELKRKINVVPLNPSDEYALIKYKNGTTEKKEFYYGSSFLSQSARFMEVNQGIGAITVMDNKGQSREIHF